MLFKVAALALAGAALALPSLDKRASKFNEKLARAGVPLEKRQAMITDTQILQYALTLEHLEDTYYRQYLAQFDAAAFTSAGYPDWVRPRFEMISSEEATHVSFLTTALATDAVAVCDYDFPVTDIASFVTLAQTLEGVGVSAYLGAAANITSKEYLTLAGSILTVEARHDAWESADVLFESAFPNTFETPLGFNQVYTLASQFITNTNCSANANLPVKAFPLLAIKPSGESVTITAPSTATIPASGVYAVFYSGPLAPYATPYTSGQATTVPANVTGGQVYVALSTSQAPTDAEVLAFGTFVIPNYIQ